MKLKESYKCTKLKQFDIILSLKVHITTLDETNIKNECSKAKKKFLRDFYCFETDIISNWTTLAPPN